MRSGLRANLFLSVICCISIALGLICWINSSQCQQDHSVTGDHLHEALPKHSEGACMKFNYNIIILVVMKSSVRCGASLLDSHEISLRRGAGTPNYNSMSLSVSSLIPSCRSSLSNSINLRIYQGPWEQSIIKSIIIIIKR